MKTWRDVVLPKWPAMTVVGQFVTPEQAEEILVRTDLWSFSMNDRERLQQVCEAVGLPSPTNLTEMYAEARERKQALGALELNLLYNDRILSSYIFGANGWIDWDGYVGQTAKNIGKWPNTEAVFDEWKRIAEAFPFLTLTAQLWSGEYTEPDIVPLVEFRVRRGQVTAMHTSLTPQVVFADPDEMDQWTMFTDEQSYREAMRRAMGIDPERLAKIVRVLESE